MFQKEKQFRCSCQYGRLLFITSFNEETINIEPMEDEHEIQFLPDNNVLLETKCKGCRKIKKFLVKFK